jgi:multidrug efflux pump subunit AcrB
LKRILFWTIHNPLMINMLMLITIVFGLISMTGLNREMFPSVVLDQVRISVAYPGASAQEVETGIIFKVEEAIEGIADFDIVQATARDNFASVLITLKSGSDLNERIQDVKNAVDGIIGLPADAEKAIVSGVIRTRAAITMVLHGTADRESLRQWAEHLKDDLLELDEISLVDVTGIPEREIAIELSEANMRGYNFTFDEIANKIRAYSMDMSGGSLKTESEELNIRIYGRRTEAAEYAEIPLRTDKDGRTIKIGDIAEVREDWEDNPVASWYDGENSITIEVKKTDSEDTITITSAVNEWVELKNQQLPGNLQLEVLRDSSIALRQRIEMLVKNFVIGLILVGLTLTLFMNLRLSFWVAMGIPISYAGMFFLFGFTPATINVISLFGMILVLGIVVDDAIVVGENIFQQVERGHSATKAAIIGTYEVSPAVFASVSTTIVAFIPFFFIEGRMGMFIWQMALAVILALSISLFECLIILPPHLAHSKFLKNPELAKKKNVVRRVLDDWIEKLINGFYNKSLRKLLGIHWVMVSSGLVFIMLTAGLVSGGVVKFSFFPRVDTDVITISVKLSPGTREARTLEVLNSIEKVSLGLKDKLRDTQSDNQEVLLSTSVILGPSSETGRVNLKLLDSEFREQSAHKITRLIKRALPVFPDVEELEAGGMGRHFGLPVNVSLLGSDIHQLEEAAAWLESKMKEFPALTEIKDNREIGKRELQLSIKPEGAALGFSLREAARQVRQAFYGQEILRFQRGRDEIRVWTRLQEEDRDSVEKLKRLRLKSPTGAMVPFSEVLDIEVGRGFVEIQHQDGKRVANITADIDENAEDATDVVATLKGEVLPELLERFQGVSLSWGGEQEQQKQSNDSMKRAFPMALIVIMFILMITFRSVIQSFIVIAMIPIGIGGAILGHLMLGKILTIMSMFGTVGLAGIIINDSVVFIDRINREVLAGKKLEDALHSAGLRRFRPILLTTITTVVGMLPIILETSRQAQFLIPMAISVSFGLLFGTVFTVYVLPCIYLSISDLRRIYGFLLNTLHGEFRIGEPDELSGGFWPTRESMEPTIRRPIPVYDEAKI